MTQTDAEIVARAMFTHLWQSDDETDWPAVDSIVHRSYMTLSAAVVTALTEAGRLVPEGAVCIDRERWERVTDAAEWASAHTETLLKPGDLDP